MTAKTNVRDEMGSMYRFVALGSPTAATTTDANLTVHVPARLNTQEPLGVQMQRYMLRLAMKRTEGFWQTDTPLRGGLRTKAAIMQARLTDFEGVSQ